MVGSITIKEIAKLCGVGVSTVSRAINNHPDINQETKDKIMRIIEDYGYVPNNAARNLKLSDGKTIAVLIKGITNPFFSDMIKVFEEACFQRGYSLVLQHVEEHQDEVDVAAALEKEKRLNGMVFLGGSFSHSREKLDRITAPFVLSTVAITSQQAYQGYAYVAVDDQKESRRIVDYLISTGRRRIAIICADERDESIGELRLKGYLAALEANNIPVDQDLILRPEMGAVYTYENGYRAVKRLLARGASFDAVYAISDTLAVGAMRALKDGGVSVPEDVALAGFDGLELGRYLTPSLTTLRQPDEEMARRTMEALFEQIGDAAAEKCHLIYEGELWIGEST